MLLIGKCNRTYEGQLTRQICVSGQNASHARAVVLHFAELTVVVVVFFLIKQYNQCLVSLTNFVIVVINW